MPARVRESVFSILRGHTEGHGVMDCFAGSGSVGLEAISRGAERCVFVERDRKVAEVLQRNIEALGAGDRCDVVIGDALGPAALSRAPRPMHLLFFDPPYKLVVEPESRVRVFRQLSRLIQLLDDDGYAIFRTPCPLYEGMVTPTDNGDETTDLLDEDLQWRDDLSDVNEVGGAKPEIDRTPVDLAIEGALGPETHRYNSMAVHLYMKQPSNERAVDGVE